jgi:hypothetical protein
MMDRDKALERIKKCMAMAEGANGNETEMETALRQAEFLMEKFAIDMAEVKKTRGKVEFVWQQGAVYFGKGNKNCPNWFQWMGVAVARFTDSIAVGCYDFEEGAGIAFKGHEEDVIFATWLLDHLKNQLRLATRQANCGSPEARETFRKTMSMGITRRLEELWRARQAKFAGNALVVVSDKIAQRDEEFGGEQYRQTKAGNGAYHNPEAAMKGFQASKNVSFNRPIGQGERKTQIGE